MNSMSGQVRLFSAIGLLILATSGCAKDAKDAPEDVPEAPPTRPMKEYAAFPGDLSRVTQPEGPLTVSLGRPEDGLLKMPVMTLNFSRAMIPPALGPQPAEQPIFQIEPAVEGVFSWVGTRTAVFHPAKPLPPATSYRITVPAGSASLDGSKLAQDVHFDLRTAYLELSAEPWPIRDQNVVKIAVSTNLPVELGALTKAVKLSRGGKAVVPRIETMNSKNKRVATRFLIEPVGGFAPATSYALTIDGGLRAVDATDDFRTGVAKNYVALSEQERRLFEQRYDADGFHAVIEPYPAFTVTSIKCGYGERCTRDSYWTVDFNNSVPTDQMHQCISFSGDLPADKHRFSGYGSTLYINPAQMKPGQSYTMTLSERCRDIYGNPLSKPRSFTRKIDYDAPSAEMLTGIKLVERGQLGKITSLPIVLGNLKNPATARRIAVSKAALPEVAARFDEFTSGAPPVRLPPPHQRTLGRDMKPGEVRHDSFDVRAGFKPDVAALFLDLDAPDTKTEWTSGYRQALIMATDLGITVKRGADQTLFWVTRLSSGAPVAGAEVAVWGANGAQVWRAETNELGIATLTPGSVKALRDEQAIGWVSATLGDDISMLNLNNWYARVGMYDFDLPVEYSQDSAQVKNFIFTERGVYKKGEPVHVKGYMRLQDAQGLQAMPVEKVSVSVTDSRGKNIALQSVALSPLGGFELDVALPADAALGTYTIKAVPVSDSAILPNKIPLAELGSGEVGTFRVEAYRTPEFEVLVEPEKAAYMVGSTAKVAVRGRYLFGAPMREANVEWSVRRVHTSFSSRHFPDFSFQPDRGSYWYYDGSPSRLLSDDEGKLGADGTRMLSLKIPRDKDFSGPQALSVEASVTDITRQQISGRARLLVHPGQYYVGVHQPEYLVRAGSVAAPQAIATDYQGRAIVGKPIELQVVRREWVSQLKKNPSGFESWVSEARDTPVSSCSVLSARSPVSCEVTVPGPGSYRVLASSRDGAGNVLQSVDYFYAYGDGSFGWGRDDTNKVELENDAAQYKIGDTAKILVKSPFDHAHALVTVEQSGVVDQFVTELRGNSPTIEVPVTARMQPNAFVSVSMIRGRVPGAPARDEDGVDLSRDERDPGRPSFKIGYTQLKVDHREKILAVSVKPDREDYRPGGQVKVDLQLRDSRGKPSAGEITFMAVDQGVLSLTGYQTPDPAEFFYTPRPLGVMNFDTRMMLSTPADLDAESEGLKSEEGGGGGIATNYRSDFAAAAAFKARIPVGKDGKAQVEFTLPDSLTSYRLMAVAVAAENRFGAADTRIKVNKPLMVRPALPRFAATGDVFQARAVIQAMDDFEGEVAVEMTLDGALTATGEQAQTIKLGRGGAQEVAFALKAELPGAARVRWSARAKNAPEAGDAVEITIPIEYPAVGANYVESGVLTAPAADSADVDEAGFARRIELPESIRPDVGGLEITLSSSRVAELVPGLEYLLNYPYGCSEQVTSQIMPLIAMRDVARALQLPGFEPKRLESVVQTGIDRLLTRQTWDGGISYWPGDSDAQAWTSVYSALAMIRARADEAYAVDAEQYLNLINYLRRLLRESLPSDEFRRASNLTTRAFALWVLAEAGAAEASYHATLYEMRDALPTTGRLLLAMAMHRADATPEYRDELLDSVLKDLRVDLGGDGGGATLKYNASQDPWGWQIWESQSRQDATLLLAMLRIRPNDPLVAKLAEGLLRQRVNGYWAGTQDTAFALLALGEYFGRAKEATPDYRVRVGVGDELVGEEVFEKVELGSRRIFIPMQKLAENAGKLLYLRRHGSGGPAYYQAKLVYVPAQPPSKAFDGGFQLTREYLGAAGPNLDKPVEQVAAGQLVKVVLTLNVPERSQYLVMEDRLPAGFEPINTAFSTTSMHQVDSALGSKTEQDYWSWFFWDLDADYIAQHDDRVEWFKTDVPAGVYRHAYLMRATTSGTFQAPAARVEAMYDPTVFGHTDARRVVVE